MSERESPLDMPGNNGDITVKQSSLAELAPDYECLET